MKRKELIIIGIVLWITIPLLHAQSLTIDSCKSLALRNNATVKNATLDVLVARQVQNQVMTKYFPNVSAMAGAYYALNPLVELGIDEIENAEARQWLYNMYAEYGAALGLPNSLSMCKKGYSVGVTAVQPVFMGGQIVNGSRLAKLGVEAAKLQKDLTQDRLLQQVEENYWLLISLQEKKQTLHQAMILLDTLYRDVNIALDAGLVTQNDRLKVVLKQNEMKSNMLKLNNGITLAGMALCQLVGVNYTDNLQLTDTIDDRIQNGHPLITEAAVSARKESHLLNLNVKAEQLKKKVLIGENLPHLMVGVGGSYGQLIFNKSKFNGLAFALLQVPLTNWWETSYKIKQQKLIIQKAENDRDDLTQKMELESRQAWNNLEEAASQVELMKTTVQNAELNLKTSEINFQAGLITVSEMLEAQTLYRQTLDQLTDAKISYKISLLRYNMLGGSDLYH